MKKIFAFVLALVMIFVLCACGTNNEIISEPEPESIEEVASEKPLKVGLICLHDQNSSYDLNFIKAFEEACEVKGVDYLIKTNIPESSACYDAAAELADEGCDVIFADSFGHEPYMAQAAEEFPNVEFCHATGTTAHTAGLPNFHNAFASIYEGRFLDGIAAGMKLNDLVAAGAEPIVGYVGAYPYAEVISGYSSFFLGVRYACPDATMKVTFTGSWYDETAEKEAATKLINDGCVIISGHADSMGFPTACELAGIPFVFYNGSVIEACPNTFIVSTRIDWVPYFKYMIEHTPTHDIATDWVGTLNTGSVVMTEVNTAVAADGTEKTLLIIAEKLINNEINVFDVSTFTVNGENLTSYMADVDTDDAYTPDTEVIINNEFVESEFRSAPYFDIAIDGIETLGE